MPAQGQPRQHEHHHHCIPGRARTQRGGRQARGKAGGHPAQAGRRDRHRDGHGRRVRAAAEAAQRGTHSGPAAGRWPRRKVLLRVQGVQGAVPEAGGLVRGGQLLRPWPWRRQRLQQQATVLGGPRRCRSAACPAQTGTARG